MPSYATTSTLLDHVRAPLRAKHSSRWTETSSMEWITHSMCFPGTRHPADRDAPHRAAVLTYVAVEQQVTASTPNHVLPALVVRSHGVLGVALVDIIHAVRAGVCTRATSNAPYRNFSCGTRGTSAGSCAFYPITMR